MSDIYAMRRANGDVFALDHQGRFRVPLFHSGRDAMIARSREFGMLLFKPVALDAGLLEELIPIDGRNDVDFWLVNDPSISLKRGCLVQRPQLAFLIREPIELQTVPGGKSYGTPSLNALPKSDVSATESGEDEGGLYARCA
jgi:hypothetical protein